MVVNDAGRSNVQDEYKGETKSIDAEVNAVLTKVKKTEKVYLQKTVRKL